MKKVISIAVSTLLLSNPSFAQVSVKASDNKDLSSTTQTTVEKTEVKKSNLGANVNTKSGLAAPKTTLTTNTTVTSKPKMSVKVDSFTNAAQEQVKEVQVQKIDKEVKTVTTTTLPTQSHVTPTFSSTIDKEQYCETAKEVCKDVKKIVRKHVVKKKVVKASPKSPRVVKNNFELVKTKDYVPVDFSQKQRWILNNQVVVSIKDDVSVYDVSISDTSGRVIPKDQFNKSFLRLVQISQDFKVINNQEREMNFVNKTYGFEKKLPTCGAVFVQYHLKSSAIPNTLVKYVDHNGFLSDVIDSSCVQKNPVDLPTDVNYSESNNVSGLLFKDNKLSSKKPLSFNLVYMKNGTNRTPADLFVYALKPDFSDLTVIEPKSYGSAVSGILYEQSLSKGKYILGYSFNEGKIENYFRNIHVD